MMSEITVSESANAQNAIDSKIMGILNSTIHHDLLQSYVRAPVESVSDSKQLEESENFDKIPSSLGTYFDKELNDDKEIGGDKKDKKNKQRENKSNKLSVESEMNIQKKKKWRRQNNSTHCQEEVYTDKDRAAAVNMGTKDIKQSLKMKQKQDRNLQLPEDTEPTAMLALGLREMRIGDVKVAMNCINKVLVYSFISIHISCITLIILKCLILL